MTIICVLKREGGKRERSFVYLRGGIERVRRARQASIVQKFFIGRLHICVQGSFECV